MGDNGACGDMVGEVHQGNTTGGFKCYIGKRSWRPFRTWSERSFATIAGEVTGGQSFGRFSCINTSFRLISTLSQALK